MPSYVKKKIKVLDAAYVAESDSIVFVGECDEGKIRQQIHSNSFVFGARNKEEEMEKLAKLLIGKKINVVFDPDINNKIKDKYTLRY